MIFKQTFIFYIVESIGDGKASSSSKAIISKTSLSPAQGVTLGGAVRVLGTPFVNSDRLKCTFGSSVSAQELLCVAAADAPPACGYVNYEHTIISLTLFVIFIVAILCSFCFILILNKS